MADFAERLQKNFARGEIFQEGALSVNKLIEECQAPMLKPML